MLNIDNNKDSNKNKINEIIKFLFKFNKFKKSKHLTKLIIPSQYIILSLKKLLYYLLIIKINLLIKLLKN